MDQSGEGNVLSIPVPIRRGGSDTNLNLDQSSDVTLDFHRNLGNLEQKILKVTEQLKIEQMERDENVAEYLKLVNSADKQQAARIRQVFEKKNQKAAHSIALLQKKLEQYHRRIKENEGNSPAKHTSPKDVFKEVSRETPREPFKDSPKDNLKDVSGSGRHPCLDKIKTIGPGVSLSPPFFFSKSKEFANLIRNKFGSADNIAHLKNTLEAPSAFHQERLGGSATIVAKPKYPSDDECSSGTSLSADSNGNPPASHDCQSRTTGLAMEEIQEIREAQAHLEGAIEALKEQFKAEYSFHTQALQEEKYRYERLEDQLNDLTELHQHEMANLKQELASIEEKVAYQANERARDIQEALESCQTRISKLELQQQQQQTVQGENTEARVLLGKCINIILAIATVILVCVSTAAKFATPLLRSRLHVLGTSITVLLLALLWKNWEHLQNAVERLLVPG
ncbi:transmembrane and coiled-coil domain protein 3-like [Chanos chanos]|uniref:Transmembrane and coiled-coil domain protein 3-like n=1 Tax=Chanos chanos TaxID=29144 RepID=A0A6J2VY18_CHACN|nr:transmembrane and coiled-coil domain protein 3-like [Chanos chanos]